MVTSYNAPAALCIINKETVALIGLILEATMVCLSFG